MEASELYADHPELRTPEEEEDENYDPWSGVPVFPTRFRTLLNGGLPSPIAAERAAFQRRPPALGLTLAELDRMEQSVKLAYPVQRRWEFRLLRDGMLRMLIPCSGAADFSSLVAILREEARLCTPAPVPDWYEYSKVVFGPRRIGYYACDARGCFFTEDASRQVLKCGGCNLAKYCSKNCQAADWKARHKVVCQKDKGDRVKMVEKASAILERFVASGGPHKGGRARQRRGPDAGKLRRADPDSDSDDDDSAAWGEWQRSMLTNVTDPAEQPTADVGFFEWLRSQWIIVAVAIAAFLLIAAAALKELGSSA